jgi:hypothetical protein
VRGDIGQVQRNKIVSEQNGTAVIEIDTAEIAALRQSGLEVIPRPDFDEVQLRSGVVNTRLARQQSAAKSAADNPLQIVQFSGPPSVVDLKALSAAGARVVHYIPQNAYMVWVAPEKGVGSLDKLKTRTSNPVRFVMPYTADRKIDPKLNLKSADGSVAVTVQLYAKGTLAADDDLAAIRALASSVIREPIEVLDGLYVNLTIELSEADIAKVAALPTVVIVESYVPRKLTGERQGQSMAGNVTANGSGPSGPGYLNWLTGLGFPTTQESYPIVGVVDDGVDNGTVNPASAEFRELNVAGSASRIPFSRGPPGSSVS